VPLRFAERLAAEKVRAGRAAEKDEAAAAGGTRGFWRRLVGR